MISVDEANTSRRSVRAIKSDPVPRETVAHIHDVASRAPSGTNTQPWHVHVLTGDSLQSLCAMPCLTPFWNEPEKHQNDRLHYMDEWRNPYPARRRKVGWDLYGLAGIRKRRTREDARVSFP